MNRSLARYLTGGPISDARIIAADENQVTFWAREGKTTGDDRAQIPTTLPIEEFTRRWSLHVLPKGYTKIRRFGGWTNRRVSQYVERSAIQLDAADAPLSEDASDFDPFADSDTLSEATVDGCERCPKCGGELRLLAERPKPTWHEVMYSASRPSWYARDSLHERKTLHRRVVIG